MNSWLLSQGNITLEGNNIIKALIELFNAIKPTAIKK
jgi:hypothetical protein